MLLGSSLPVMGGGGTMKKFRKIDILILILKLIVPPPPITGRDEPNNTLMTFLMYLLYHEIRQNVDVF